MTISVQQLEDWLAKRHEGPNLEFKEAKTQIDNNKLYKYCVAIANEGGGYLILGISDDKPRRIVGTKAFKDTQALEQKTFDALKFRIDVQTVEHPGGRVLVIAIPARPRGTAYQYQGGYWMRSGEALVPMTEDRLRSIFQETDTEWLDIHSKTDCNADKIIELLDTQSYFELIDQPYPVNQYKVIQKLCLDEIIDSYGETYAIRRIGALLLAKNLRDFPDIARKSPRVIVFDGNNKLHTRLDQTGQKGYAVGFQGLIEFVIAQLPQNEIIQDALRKEIKLLPEVIIRELIANSLIHQDFSIRGASPMIEIFSNRIEISNPGKPIVEVERFIDGYRSRNERLADTMRRMGICEERGSGVDRVVNASEMLQLPAPDFRTTNDRTIVVIYGPKPFEEMDRDDRIRACYQHCALKWVMAEKMTNQSLRARFKLAPDRAAVVSQIISATIDAGLVKADETAGSSRKYARYLPFWA